MSILINGMEMPSNCMECEWRDAEACGECELMIDNPFRSFSDQYAHCPFQMIAKRHPLVLVPEHGRLIDADVLRQRMYHEAFETDSDMQKWGGCWIRYKMFENVLESAPTIIPAE